MFLHNKVSVYGHFYRKNVGTAVLKIVLLQINEYETAPYFIQFSQNLTCDSLLVSVFSPQFT